MEKFNFNFNIKGFFTNFKEKLLSASADTLGWIANITLHCATIPNLVAVSMGVTDKLPSIDLVLLVWSGLTLLFVKAIISKDMLNIATIGVGFIIQSVLMALIFFR